MVHWLVCSTSNAPILRNPPIPRHRRRLTLRSTLFKADPPQQQQQALDQGTYGALAIQLTELPSGSDTFKIPPSSLSTEKILPHIIQIQPNFTPPTQSQLSDRSYCILLYSSNPTAQHLSGTFSIQPPPITYCLLPRSCTSIAVHCRVSPVEGLSQFVWFNTRRLRGGVRLKRRGEVG
jgi:hypothetical protein